MRGAEITRLYRHKNDNLRLLVRRNDVKIKVELSPVMRETVFESKIMPACETVRKKTSALRKSLSHRSRMCMLERSARLWTASTPGTCLT